MHVRSAMFQWGLKNTLESKVLQGYFNRAMDVFFGALQGISMAYQGFLKKL